jgi:DNA-binding MarR family transcriptional regulator
MPSKTETKSEKKPARVALDRPFMLYMMRRVQYKAYVRLEAALQPLGVTAAQFRILAALENHDRRSSADLSRMFAVKPQTMIKQVAILEAKQLIRRTVAANNKRVLEVALTDLGAQVLERCNLATAKLEAKLFESLSKEDIGQYRRILSTLLASLPRAEGEVAEYDMIVR